MNAVVCVDSRWGIGIRGELLVNIPADKKVFKQLTIGKTVLGGRKTMEGLPGGVALSGRTNLVLTGQPDYSFGDAVVVHSVDEAVRELARVQDEDVYIIGGGMVYETFLPYCSRVYVTRVDRCFEADVFFPDLDAAAEWERVSCSERQEYGDMGYCFMIYERKANS